MHNMSVNVAVEQFFKLTWPNRRDTSGSLTFFGIFGAIKAVPGIRLNISAKKGYVLARKEIDTHKKTMKTSNTKLQELVCVVSCQLFQNHYR